MTLPVNVLRYGHEEPLPAPVHLWAGPLSLIYLEGDLRFITLGGHEVIRRIYVAVRDRNWGTVPAELSDVCIHRARDHFEVRYRARHRQREIDFSWEGAIVGGADGTITFTMDGVARSTFLRNRIGFCVLHPMTCTGVECVVEHVDGTTERGHFPRCISPHQPFKDVRAISHRVAGDAWVTVRMDGDTFEMEDQRNWTDASFKTYCTPLEEPFPVEVREGTRIRQSSTLTLRGAEALGATSPVTVTEEPVTVTIRPEEHPLPRLGVSIGADAPPLTPREADRLRRLHLDYLFVDIDLTAPGWEDLLRRAVQDARSVGVPLRAALTVSGNVRRDLGALLVELEGLQPRVSAWFVHDAGRPATLGETAALAREVLGAYDPRVPLGGGTRANFTELNRNRTPADALDLFTYAITPQMHAFDNLSLVETLPAQAATVESARKFAGGKPIVINPVTLRLRFNPVATGPEPPPGPDELPRNVDPRQMSLFCAGWTVGSLAYLAGAGVESITYYEATGWRGVMEREEGSPLPEVFRSIPGGVYPVYHALAAVGEFAGGVVLRSVSSDPLRVVALALRKGEDVGLLVANLTDRRQRLRLEGVHTVTVRWVLDDSSAEEAMRTGLGIPEGPQDISELPPCSLGLWAASGS